MVRILQELDDHGFHIKFFNILDFKDDTTAKYVSNKIEVCGQKSDGRTDERSNGDIEALADARQALKD